MNHNYNNLPRLNHFNSPITLNINHVPSDSTHTHVQCALYNTMHITSKFIHKVEPNAAQITFLRRSGSGGEKVTRATSDGWQAMITCWACVHNTGIHNTGTHNTGTHNTAQLMSIAGACQIYIPHHFHQLINLRHFIHVRCNNITSLSTYTKNCVSPFANKQLHTSCPTL